MKFAAAVWSVNPLIKEGGLTQKGFIPLCRGLQCDAVELFDLYLGKDREKELAELKDELEKNGIPACVYMVNNDFTDPGAFEENFKNCVSGIRAAAFLGAPMCRVLGGNTHDLGERDKASVLEFAAGALKRLVPAAEENGVTMVLENHGDLPGSADELLQILDSVNSDRLKACCDMGNFISGGMKVKRNPLEELKKLGGRVAHVHVKDRRFSPGARGDVEPCVPGTGELPLRECMHELKSSGYEGYVSCEFDGDDRVDIMTGFISALANIRYAANMGKP